MRATDETARCEALARDLHAHPELSLQEHHAASECIGLLREWGFAVDEAVAGLPTAFTATRRLGTGSGPTVGLVAEYDALPGVGHGCGHHLMAGGVLEAAARLAAEPVDGTLVVFGTPAEETGVGKVVMHEAGVFDPIDVALAYHPSDQDAVWGRNNGTVLFDMVFEGRSSHAGSRPWDGRSAQDGVEAMLHGLALERQYHRDGCRIHAIVQEVHGAHNVLPDEARAAVNVRAPEVGSLDALATRAEQIARAAAEMTATSVTIRTHERLLPFRADLALAELAWQEMGLPAGTFYNFGGSSDLGNVSHDVRTVCITTGGWPPVTWHSRELHEATGTDVAYESMHRAATALTAIGSRIFSEGLPHDVPA